MRKPAHPVKLASPKLAISDARTLKKPPSHGDFVVQGSKICSTAHEASGLQINVRVPFGPADVSPRGVQEVRVCSGGSFGGLPDSM